MFKKIKEWFLGKPDQAAQAPYKVETPAITVGPEIYAYPLTGVDTALLIPKLPEPTATPPMPAVKPAKKAPAAKKTAAKTTKVPVAKAKAPVAKKPAAAKIAAPRAKKPATPAK